MLGSEARRLTHAALLNCALYYGRAETDSDFDRARRVLAESIIRSLVEAPKCAIRITHGLDTPEWTDVAEAAIAICDAEDDITVALNRLRVAGERWMKIAKWVPEPWRSSS